MKIPAIQEQQRMGVTSPVSVRESGIARIRGEATQSLGKSIGGAVDLVSEIVTQQESDLRQAKLNERKDSLYEAHIEATRTAKELGAADGADLVDIYDQSISKSRSKIYDGLDERAQAEIKHVDERFRMSSQEELFGEKLRRGDTILAKSYVDSEQKMLMRVQDEPEAAYVHAHNFYSDWGGKFPTSYSQNKREALVAETKERVSEAVFQGYYTKGQVTPVHLQKGLALARSLGKDQDHAAFIRLTPREAVAMGNITEEEAKGLKEFVVRADNLEAAEGEAGYESIKAAAMNISADSRADWIRRFQGAIESRANEEKSDILLEFPHLENRLKSGEYVPPHEIDSMMNRINNNAAFTPKGRVYQAAKLVAAKEYGAIIDNVRRKPRGERMASLIGLEQRLDAAIDRAGKKSGLKLGSYFADRISEGYEKNGEAILEKIRLEERRDPAPYFIHLDDNIRQKAEATKSGDPNATHEYLSALIAKQKSFGFKGDEVRVVSNSLATQMASELEVDVRTGNGVESIRNIKAQYGKHADYVFADIARAGDNKGFLVLASKLSDDGAMKAILRNTGEEAKELRESYSGKNSIVPKAKRDELTEEVYKKSEDYMFALMQTFDRREFKASNDIRDLVHLEAMRYQQKGMDPEDAADLAVDTILRKNFSIAQGGGTYSLLPKFDSGGRPVEVGRVSDFFAQYSNPATFRSLDVAVPDQFRKDMEMAGVTKRREPLLQPSTGVVVESDDPARDEWYRQLGSRVIWRQNPTMTGYNMVDPVEGTVVLDSLGNPIEVTHEQIMSELPIERSVSRMKRFGEYMPARMKVKGE